MHPQLCFKTISKMKQDNVLFLIATVSVLLAIPLAFTDNLSEAAPVLLLLGLGCFIWLIYRRTWQIKGDKELTEGIKATSVFSKLSSLLAIGGILSFGLSGLALLDSKLEEFAIAGCSLGIILLVFALIARIIHGIRVKRVDTTTGRLSIVVILGLLGIIVVILLAIFVGYLLLNGFGVL